MPHADLAPSEWVARWSHLVPAGSPVLDVACGMGRHMQWFQARNHPVTGIDRADIAVSHSAAWGRVIQADIENGPWPFAGGPGEPDGMVQFGAVIVTNYLWRPVLPAILGSVARAGVLIYETFSQGNETVGKPSRPDFLLQPGELIRACQNSSGFTIVAYENGFLPAPERFVQRIVAVRNAQVVNPQQHPCRHGLA